MAHLEKRYLRPVCVTPPEAWTTPHSQFGDVLCFSFAVSSAVHGNCWCPLDGILLMRERLQSNDVNQKMSPESQIVTVLFQLPDEK